jgi:hypothetical protein
MSASLQGPDIAGLAAHVCFLPISATFLLHGLSYMKGALPERADCLQERIGGVDGGGG